VTSGLIIGATFAGFSYFSPILIKVTGFAPTTIPWLLMGYGIANVLGNLLVGRLADRHTLKVQGVGLAVLALGFALFARGAEQPAVSLVALALIGVTGVALNPAMVARVMAAATPGPLVNTLHTSVITAGLAVGAWAGGAAIDAGRGLQAPLWVGLGMAVLGLLSLAPLAMKRNRLTASQPCEG
jgi:predicted MFS family arabinose efflux permease